MKIANFQTLSSEKTRPSKTVPPLIDKFWEPIEPKLKAMVNPSNYDDVYDRHIVSDEILLFITAPLQLCTVELSLYFPGDHVGSDEASYQQTVDLLKGGSQGTKKKPRTSSSFFENLPKVPRNFTFNERLGFHESKQIQFKDVSKSETILGENNRTQRDAIRKQFSAFANARGGVIFLGVTDNGEVVGFNLKDNSREVMEERVISLVGRIQNSVKLLRKVHWDMEFFPISGCCDSKAVLVIKVGGLKSLGGIFSKCPKSFVLQKSDDGEEVVHELNFDEWKKGMLSGEDLCTDNKGWLIILSVLPIICFCILSCLESRYV